jgi:hypothetical protein
MAVLIIPFAMLVIGALMYALSANPKLAELGRLLFAAGAFGIAIGFVTTKITFP